MLSRILRRTPSLRTRVAFATAIGAAIVALCLSVHPVQGAVLALWVGCGAAALGSVVSFLRLLPSVRGG